MYNLTAEFYDRRYREIQFEKYKNSLPFVSLSGRILDHGCGTGLFHEYLKYFNMIGIDNSSKMIEIAQKKGEKVVLGDIENLPFTNNSFDIVFSFTTIQNSKNYNATLTEVKRVLKNNGSFICSFVHHFQKRIEPELKKYFKITHFFRNTEDVTYICTI